MLLGCIAPFGAQAQSPFGPGEDYVLSLDSCAGVLDMRQPHPPLGTWDFAHADGARLRITMVGIDFFEAQVFAGDDARGPNVDVHVPLTTPGDVGSAAVCDDLNRDGVVDFVINLWKHGNGLGASFYDRLIVLSSADTYRFWVIPTMSPSPTDFVTFGKVEPIVMLSTEFVQKHDGGTFGESRSYSVYNLWTFRGGDVVNADLIDDRFPKWVRWTFRQPNWQPARSVSDEERRSRNPPRVVEAVP